MWKVNQTSRYFSRKLSDEQKDEIISLKGTIQFLWDPDKMKENLQRRIERGGSKIYYSKEKNREYMKLHRHYKQEIYLKEKNNEILR